MYRSVKEMVGLPIHAVDGVIGKIDQFLFDDQNWAVRYIVADIGSWLTGKRVIISPAAVEEIRESTLLVKNTREQIRNSPDIDVAEPVSRQKEQEIHDHFAWPYYWIYPGNYSSLGGALYPGLTPPFAYEQEEMFTEALQRDSEMEEKTRHSHLRGTREVSGYQIQATDEEVGSVADFILDDNQWALRYLVVDTGTLLHGKEVLLAPQWTRGVDWGEAVVYVAFNRERIRHSPEYNPSVPITQEYETRLYSYYEDSK